MNEPKAISEPTIMGRTNELLNHIDTLERHCADMESGLTGRAQSSEVKRDTPSSLEGMLADATTRTASLCGWMATMKNRLGCHEWESEASIPKPEIAISRR